MENNINSKKSKLFNMIHNFKKIIMLSLLFLITLNYVNAGTFIYEQSKVLSDYNTANLGSSMLFSIAGNKNSESLGNRTGDLKLEFADIENPQFILFLNTVENSQMNISYLFSKSNATITEYLTFQELGTYYFKLQPNYKGEAVSVLFQTQDNIASTIQIKQQVPQGLNYVVESFVGAINELININIGLWKLFYYIVIIGLIFTGIGLMFGFAFKIYEWSEKIAEKKYKMIHKEPKYRR